MILESRICGIEYYLPTRIVTNKEIQAQVDVSPTYIEEKLGIHQRHFAAADETAASMGTQAAKKLLSNRGIDKNSIDLLVGVTQNPDYILPGITSLIHRDLDLGLHVGAFDINLACSGFTYALGVAASQIKAGLANTCLIVTSDCYSRRMNMKDKSVCTMFGDAATAVLVEKSPGPQGFLAFDFGTDGRGYDKLIIPAGGIKEPLSVDTALERTIAPGVVRSRENLVMEGKDVFQFALDTVPISVERVLHSADLAKDNIDYFIFHQANKYMLEALAKRLDLPLDKVIIDMRDCGNTVSSTIPIALANLMNNGTLKTGQNLLLCGFGVGLSWASCIYRT